MMLRRMAGLIKGFVSSLMKFTFTIGISRPCITIGKMHKGYEEADMAVNHRMVIGYDHIIFFEELGEENDFIVVYLFSIEKQIIDCIKLGRRKELIKLLDEFEEHLVATWRENIKLIHYYFLQLLTASIKCFYEIDHSFGMKLMQKEYYSAVFKEGTIREVTVRMKNLYSEFLDYMELMREGKNREKNQDLIQNINQYIQDNIGQDLTLEHISTKYQLSPYQLRKLFRDEKGVSPKNYIDNIKMNKAIELLVKTDLKIGEVAQCVGYFSVPSFIHTFKAVTGMTPGEYRSESRKNSY